MSSEDDARDGAAAASTASTATTAASPPTDSRDREPILREVPPPPPAPAPREHRTTGEHRSDRGDRDRKKDDRDADALPESIRQRLEHLVPELVKKTFTAGLGAVFSTEEGIRKIAREVSIPSPSGVAGYITSSADGAKDRVLEIVARETREFLSNLNLTDELAKLLTTLSLEVKTEIRFIPNSERFTGAEPDVKASVKLRRVDDKSEPEEKSRLRFWRRDRESRGDDEDPNDR